MTDMTIEEAKDLLDLNEGDDLAAVKKAIKRMSQRYHPDKEGGDAVKFDKVRVAGELLTELLGSYETIPSSADLEAIAYIASNLVQLYVNAEMSGDNEIRRSHNRDVDRRLSLGDVFFMGTKKPTPEAYALNRLEERIRKDIEELVHTADNLRLQGKALRTMLRNYRAPALARKAWKDVRDKLAGAIWSSRADRRTLESRLSALLEFEEIIVDSMTPKKTFALPTTSTRHVRY